MSWATFQFTINLDKLNATELAALSVIGFDHLRFGIDRHNLLEAVDAAGIANAGNDYDEEILAMRKIFENGVVE